MRFLSEVTVWESTSEAMLQTKVCQQLTAYTTSVRTHTHTRAHTVGAQQACRWVPAERYGYVRGRQGQRHPRGSLFRKTPAEDSWGADRWFATGRQNLRARAHTHPHAHPHTHRKPKRIWRIREYTYLQWIRWFTHFGAHPRWNSLSYASFKNVHTPSEGRENAVIETGGRGGECDPVTPLNHHLLQTFCQHKTDISVCV